MYNCNKKKANVSIWIWISGGIIVGMITLSIAYKQLYGVTDSAVMYKVIEDFSTLGTKINSLCWSYEGTSTKIGIHLSSDVESLFVANESSLDTLYFQKNRKEITEKLKNETIEGKENKGDVLCLKLQKRRARCIKLDCFAMSKTVGYINPKRSIFSALLKIKEKEQTPKYRIDLTKIRNGTEDIVNMTMKRI